MTAPLGTLVEDIDVITRLMKTMACTGPGAMA